MKKKCINTLSACRRLLLLVAVSVLCTSGSFDDLFKIKKEERVASFRRFYLERIEKKDAATGYQLFNELVAKAEKENDYPLLSTIYQHMGEYEEQFGIGKSNDKKVMQFYTKAENIATENGLLLQQAQAIHKKGVFSYYRQQYGPAFEYLLKADGLFRKVGFANEPSIKQILLNTGLIYYDFKDADNALRFLSEADKTTEGNHWQNVMTINTIALVYRNKKMYDSAMLFFKRTLKVAETNKDSVWIGIVSSNIGSVYLQQQAYDKALPYFQTAYQLTLKANEVYTAAEALTASGKICLLQNNTSSAEQQLLTAEPLLQKANDIIKWRDWYEVMGLLNDRKGNATQAVQYWKKYIAAKDSADKRYNGKLYADAQIKIEAEKHLANVKLIEQEKSGELLKRNAILGAVFLLMVIALLLYNRQRVKNKNERALFEKQEALLQSEKLRTEEELLNAGNELAHFTESLKKKNELIDNFKEEIEKLQALPNSPVQVEKTDNIEKLLQSTILTEEDWTNFKELFDKVYKGFSIRLKEKASDLTQAEARLLILTRLNLNTKEMASMLGISVDTIKKTRQRVRKKINITEEDSLEDFVLAI